MVASHKVAVVIYPPPVNPELYKPFDEEFDRTVDRILSEEASIEEAREQEKSDENLDFGIGAVDDESTGLSTRSLRNTKKSPYFPPPVTETTYFPTEEKHSKRKYSKGKDSKGKRSPEVQRSITGMDVDNHVPEVLHQSMGGNPMNGTDDHIPLPAFTPNAPDGAVEAEAPEEDILFASLESPQRDDLLHFIASHPFMHQPQPARRSARRQFTDQIRNEAMQLGMDKESANGLIQYVRQLYLGIHGIESTADFDNVEGSTFGDEVDDESERYACGSRRKNRKRSVDDHGEHAKPKKKSKRRSSSDSKAQPWAAPQNGHEAVVVDLSDIFKSNLNGYSDVDERIAVDPVSQKAANIEKTLDAEKGTDAVDSPPQYEEWTGFEEEQQPVDTGTDLLVVDISNGNGVSHDPPQDQTLPSALKGPISEPQSHEQESVDHAREQAKKEKNRKKRARNKDRRNRRHRESLQSAPGSPPSHPEPEAQLQPSTPVSKSASPRKSFLSPDPSQWDVDF
ncbi:hypothetical protein NUU61_006886 [Penicillium alfredii]|uniref:Uncharacterized protein n=1 Tax=Penicillium alfredii TaxID=1506179 RepID=A0A9W9F1V4_9EURO|nr:uncharacterized protein NUU61_006886 [Penicillium alfredii]KAJ5092016.1 hypothetical protein NUU61_006886 [Penicillium alfredii]